MNKHIARSISRAFAVVVLIVVVASAMQRDIDGTLSQNFLDSVTKGDVARVRELLNQDPALARTTGKDGVTVLLKAVYNGKNDVAELLLAGRNDLNIFEASATGRTARVASLLKQDRALANAFAPDGFFPLGLAAFFKHPETVAVLLEAGADVNAQARNAMGVRAIHAAAASAQLEIARMLVKRHADVNARQQAGFTPLHEAAMTGQIEFARLLLDHGADVNAKADNGKTALTLAIQAGQEEIAKILRERGATK
ncbi:MAG TPA: ankyrin repeat domain-containing protein [Blastocatellia bacterium]|nr:ankyrin repeat domain-containing protein [Blastocatellia bacterium]